MAIFVTDLIFNDWFLYRGLTPAEAEFNYLNTARTLELYGVEFHYARVSEEDLFWCFECASIEAQASFVLFCFVLAF